MNDLGPQLERLHAVAAEAGIVCSPRGGIVVSAGMETSEPGIYAIGDVIGPPALAHVAGEEAILCVEQFAFKDGKEMVTLVLNTNYSVYQTKMEG